MAGALTSKATFAERVKELGLESIMPKFVEKNWDTLGLFGFSSGHVPGMGGEGEWISSTCVELLGADAANSPLLSPLRWLYYEAFTWATNDLRRRLEATGDEPARTLTMPERSARRAQYLQEWGHYESNEHMPADSTVDLVVDMYEKDKLKHIPVEACPKGSQEVSVHPPKKYLAEDLAGYFRSRAGHAVLQPDPSISDEKLKLDWAFIRRGGAYEQGHVMSMKVHERLRKMYFKKLMGEPCDSSRYQAPSVEHIHRADLWLFQEVAERLHGQSVRRGPDGKSAVDVEVQKVMDSHEFALLLAPVPKSAGSGGGGGGAGPKSGSSAGAMASGNDSGSKRAGQTPPNPNSKRQKKLAARAAAVAAQAPPQNQARQAGGGGSPAKGVGKGPKLPLELVGTNPSGPEGRRCFGFNLGQCTQAQPGQQCPRGLWHKCMRCGGDHPAAGPNPCKLPVAP